MPVLTTEKLGAGAGRPDDIAAMCSFLVRDEADYVTGQVLGVNGGRNT
jgi:2-hydroxycyclohexanecarboxyl-CoA dehydrogenase